MLLEFKRRETIPIGNVVMPSIWWLVVLVLNLSFRVPTVGRPRENFFGALGHGVEVQMRTDRTELRVEEPLTLWVVIRGAWNPSQIVRPDLRRLPEFAQNFFIEDLEVPRGQAPSREFGYRLRPRSESVREIPPLLMRYWDPVLRYFPATAPSESILLHVQGNPDLSPKDSLLGEPEFLLETCAVGELEGDRSAGRYVAMQMGLALLGPMGAGLGWFLFWRFRNRPPRPGDLQVWRNAFDQLRELQLGSLSSMALADAVDRILREGLLRSEPSSDSASIHDASVDPTRVKNREVLADALASLRKRCERIRFGPPGTRDDSLLDDALGLVARFVGCKP